MIKGKYYKHSNGNLYRVTKLPHMKYDKKWVTGVDYINKQGEEFRRPLFLFLRKFKESSEKFSIFVRIKLFFVSLFNS